MRSSEATDPFPQVEQVRPGLWSVPVPLPNNSLRYVLVYVFETDRGAYLVDAGWNTDEAYDALHSGLASIGCALGDVQGVLVTHVHPDHYGLAGRVREASGAWVALHPADAALLHDFHGPVPDLAGMIADGLRRVGAPAEEVERVRRAAFPVSPVAHQVLPDVLLDDGARPEVPGWDLSAIWTPGHSPGHLCFWEARHAVLLSGDHVLPRITPNVAHNPRVGGDPLGDFLRSLDKLEPYEATEVLPAHEYRFTDLQGRLDELRQHHLARFGEVLRALHDGVDTAWDIAAHMVWSRPWHQIDGWMRRAAVGEAMAHLRALAERGLVAEDEGEPTRWSVIAD